jgi:hypothetical protein
MSKSEIHHQIHFKEPLLKKGTFLEVISNYKDYGSIIRNIEVVALQCYAKTHDIKILNKVYYPETFGLRFSVAKFEHDFIVITYRHDTDDGRGDKWKIKEDDWSQTVDELYDLIVCLICRKDIVFDLEEYISELLTKPYNEDFLENIMDEIFDFFT